MKTPATSSAKSPFAAAQKGKKIAGPLQISREGVAFLLCLSILINLLMLTGPVFMMQVYDRVLSSQSLATLAVLLGLVVVIYAAQAALDALRTRAGARLAARADAAIAPQIFRLAGLRARLNQRGGDAQQPLRDLDVLRQFNSSPGPMTLFDLPWTPVYLIVISLFHPILGLVSGAGAVILFTLTLVTDRVSRQQNTQVSEHLSARNAIAENSLQDAETATAMKIFDRLGQSWQHAHNGLVTAQLTLSDRAGDLGALAKGFRFLLQSVTLATGAWLVIRGELSAGSMMATSVLSSRALAPIEQAIGQWRGFRAARAALHRLEQGVELMPADRQGIDLALPCKTLDVTHMSVAPTGQNRPILNAITLNLVAGDGLGVIGPSGAGKTSLLRAILGIWPASPGSIRFDGATPDQWRNGARDFTGYLPQDIRLLPGTIAENIASFDPNATSDDVVKAAQMSGVHDLILSLPEGYNARIGDAGTTLSGGQRQRIALARAVYRTPFLVVMDEPNAHLDAAGDQALSDTIARLRAAGSIVICIAHRPAALAALNKVAMIEDGRLRAFGPRDDVLGQVIRHPRAVSPTLPQNGAAQTAHAGA